LKDGRSEIHIFRKYFITKRGIGTNLKNPFSETSWVLDIDKDTMFRMRVQSPNTNFKISLTSTSGAILADSASVQGFGASISSVISRDKLDSDSKVKINFRFYDFLKTPEEIVEHEDVHDCHLPHIVLEMGIMSVDEFKSRKEEYKKDIPSYAEITFPSIEDRDIGYSGGVEQSDKLSSADNLYSLSKTDSETHGKFQILNEYHITISSEEEKRNHKDAANLLYYLQLQIIADFMTSGSMHVVIAHEKDEIDQMVTKQALFQYDTLN
jgi:hypothetical protein